MMLQIFAVWDQAAEAFMNPFFLTTKGQAIRGFSDAVNEQGHQMNRHAQDYTLFHLGEFDPRNGEVSVFSTPASIGLAVEFLKPSDQLEFPQLEEA